jgi:hypothetical protein
MLDLKNNKYDMQVLKEHIYAISLIEVLETQHLTSDFVLKYILNPKYQMTCEEENISIMHVLLYQPHLINTNLLDDYSRGLKKVDSFEDFETFANKNS